MSHSSIVRTYGTRGKGRSSPDHIIIKGMKALHLLAATAWAGGAMSMQALSFIRLSSEDPVRVAQAGYCLYFVDTWIVMPGLGLCILTGLFYSMCTAIGFFKFFWIAYKWVITLAVLERSGGSPYRMACAARPGLASAFRAGLHPARKHV